jgi:hypothetical protein
VRRNDFTTAGRWSSDAGLSRLIRLDPTLSAVPLLEGSAPLRDYEELPSAPTLALSSAEPLTGFREKRLYRTLFSRVPAEPSPGGEIAEGGDRYLWQLRRIGNGVAWCLDVTAHLDEGTTLGSVLDRLTGIMRLGYRLIPVTTERLL